MTTSIEDDQLNTELQELYLLSKHWLSDLDFLETDLDFLKKLLEGTLHTRIKKDDSKKIATILLRVEHIVQVQAELKDAIRSYLHKLGHLIDETDLFFKINLIETHAGLEQNLNKILLNFKSLKKAGFDLAKENLKESAINL